MAVFAAFAVLVGSTPAFGQAAASDAPAAGAESSFIPPRTAWGDPDLQGTYTNKTITPLQRPTQFADKPFLTAEEVAELESAAEARDRDANREVGTERDVSGAYNDFWWDGGTQTAGLRTSLIIDPPNGRMPNLTPDAERRNQLDTVAWEFKNAGAAQGRGTDSWLDRSFFERCITRGMPGAMLPSAYNNTYVIVQSPGYVAVQLEMFPHVRVIPVGPKPALGSGVRLLLGDPRGHWEGDTLVVETGNFTDKVSYSGAAENMRLVERFRLVDEDLLDYQVTVEDATTFTAPWTASVPMRRTDEHLFEYACHEGNYGLEGILSAARSEEAGR
jgi:hypothetical protein